MPRPRKLRYVQMPPVINCFRPNRLPPWGGAVILLSIEGLEAVRLSDFEGLDQETAAQRMNVSRQTYGRILAAARRTVAEALVLGRTLRIEGGNFEMPPGGGRRHRRGRGRVF
jgi:predicted DNA-binding protein (UPF0251 family)